MRSMWAGTVSFGLVSIPVRLYPAAAPREVAFRQVHTEDGGRISFRRVCTACGRDVPYAGVARGFELPDGDLVVLSDEDLASLPRERSHRIDVLSFTSGRDIDPMLADRGYYLEPAASGARAYRVLATALQRAGKVAVATVTLRQRETLAQLRARDGVLVLQTLLWPDEVRAADFPVLDEDRDARDEELAAAVSLIDAMTAPFDPAAHHDRYPAELADLVQAKVSGRHPGGPFPDGPFPDGPSAGEPFPGGPFPDDDPGESARTQDLAGALRASLDLARARRRSATA